MKRFNIFLFLVVFLFLCNNESETYPENFQVGTEKSYKPGDDYLSDVESLKFKISEINDSRCPSDVTCIWQGEALVTIDLEIPFKGTIRLSTYDNQTDTIGNYSFKLVEIEPYPLSTKIIKLEDYEITLKIDKLLDN